MLILRMLQAGPAHGLQIAQDIERRSDDVLLVEQGSLYPALHRLENRGWITSSWGVSESNRKARYYQITPIGKSSSPPNPAAGQHSPARLPARCDRST